MYSLKLPRHVDDRHLKITQGLWLVVCPVLFKFVVISV
jgi:hypothetical protein